MGKRLTVVAVLFVMLFGILSVITALVASNPVYAQAAAQQSEVTIPLSQGRGNIYDCNFNALTGKMTRQYALLEPGRGSYHSMFDVILPEERPLFYENIRQGAPFLMRMNEECKDAPYTYARPVRYLPFPIAPHLVGYLDAQGRGVCGIERACDEWLAHSSTDTRVRCFTNARGGVIKQSPPQLLETHGTGAGVMLTLDQKIQRMCEAIAADSIDQGCIMVLDVHTGRVRAAVSMPRFDPYDVAQSIRRKDTSLVDRTVSAYNVGSVFKPLLAAAALEQGVDPQEQYHCRGYVEIGGHVYRCAHGRGHGDVNMKTALAESCNCYFIHLGLELGADAVYKTAQQAGFGESNTIIGTYRTAAGNLPSVEELSNLGQLASVSFGQGALMATPVQVAAMMNLFAGNGEYIAPSFVEGVVDEYSKTVTQSLYRPVRRRVFSEKTIETLRPMLTGVVEEGLGKKAQTRKGGAGGKTGTAQTGRFDDEGNEILDAWFAGFYPAQDPQYTVTVLLDSGTHGSDDAAVVFAKVCDSLSFFFE